MDVISYQGGPILRQMNALLGFRGLGFLPPPDLEWYGSISPGRTVQSTICSISVQHIRRLVRSLRLEGCPGPYIIPNDSYLCFIRFVR